MLSIQDRQPGKKTSIVMADYDALLARAVENLPNSSPAGRAALYERARAALISQLQSSKRPVSIEAEVRVLDDAIDRLESRINERAQYAQEPSRSGGWLNNLLTRVSRPSVVTPKLRTASDLPLDQHVRSPTPRLLRTSERTASREIKQGALRVAVAREPPIERYVVRETVSPTSWGGQEKPISRADQLNQILCKLQNDSPGVEASALISEDGLMIASALSTGMEESRVAGMTATLLNLGSRAAVELSRGGMQEVIVRGEHGYIVLISTGRGALLLALTDESSKLGLIFYDMREAVRSLSGVL